MKADRLLICDLDFSGSNQFDAQESIYFDAGSDITEGILQTAFNVISAKKITSVFIIVHGISTTTSEGYNGMSMEAGYSLPERVGGFGLALGKGLIDVTNDYLFRKWAPCKLKNIVFLSCSAASSDPARVGGWGDGKLMLQHIANATGANVYCADAMQYINRDWEGDMFKFPPHSTSRGVRVNRPYPGILKRTFASYAESFDPWSE
ncbi:hypothetical protein [Dyadobacter aurulentus]|uniref:hypothetical protein n=1 Tax=Dyadobacter sp. UC 10 TaxID=2605428 RepID=UPI0011F28A05|nr:hypothetical protein [Dyadobacter sp. UC 10]KAA0990301.1 hypothetical protein FXO21_09115 [Dyadobacter sp. UC 10]